MSFFKEEIIDSQFVRCDVTFYKYSSKRVRKYSKYDKV